MTYHAVTVTLENIGGIVAQKDKNGARTVRTAFNVTVAGKRQYAVQIAGAPRLENGMVVTAVLRDTENWQTLAGWLNHATGEICGVESPGKSLFLCLFGFLLSVLFTVKMTSGNVSAGGFTFWCVAVIAMNAWTIFSWRKSAMIYRLLKP
ncbi:hypothetical protein [Paraburkholderia aromaticivorans]|uniref:hypothetical protein n=1 Tax=Paraburkholderia aromaticivorans TaxID=2026199 RepID=UPI00145625F7|nr:hypothetical protein [Paraburkholderia aromaticivorans]